MTPITYFKNYPDPFYADWQSEPVPGWGARPVMAGPRMVAVGETPAPRLPTGEPRLVDRKWFYPSVAIGVLGLGALIFFMRRK